MQALQEERLLRGIGHPGHSVLETESLLVLVAHGSVSVSMAWADAPSQGKDGEWAVAQGIICHHLKAKGSLRTLVPQ